MSDPCSESRKVLSLLLDPTWAAITSEAPWVTKFLLVHGVMDRIDVLRAKVLIGRLHRRRKKTGTVFLSVKNY